MRALHITFITGLLGVGAPASLDAQNYRKAHSYVPPNGVVADSITAVRIAEAVLVPIWGEESIVAHRPLVARLQKGVWIIRGNQAEGKIGDVILEITKKDGRILRTWLFK